MKIYTKTGDAGQTGLIDGSRVAKDDPRVAAYGEVDELNSALGVAREELRDPAQQEIADIVDRLQSELFNLGGELATPDAAAAHVPDREGRDEETAEREDPVAPRVGDRADVVAEELRGAQQALNEITGEFTSDDLLGRIFSSFCIGK